MPTLYPMEDASQIIAFTAPYTMTTPQCVTATVNAVRHVVRNGVPGDIVECGVWLGGSSMAMAMALLESMPSALDLTMRPLSDGDIAALKAEFEKVLDQPRREAMKFLPSNAVPEAVRRLWLFDTFEGMTRPTRLDGQEANDAWRSHAPDWLRVGLETVQDHMRLTGYPSGAITYVKGPVERTLPGTVIKQIAVLRLDTDWYASTKAELENLWPLVSPGGVMILDDYACWPGCQQAVDEYFGPPGQSTVTTFPIGAFGIVIIKE